MKFEEFELERNQSLFENEVDYNLSESGVHPLKMSEILTKDEQAQILDEELLYGYTNGTPQLRKSVIDIYDKELSLENVLITSGSAEANFLSIMTQLDRGDEIVYMIPNYLQIYHLARSLGIEVKTLPIRQELGWQWDPDELKNMVSSNTKMIVICNPNNPTGAIMDSQIMDKIIEIAEKNDCWILSDEVYRGAESDLPVDLGVTTDDGGAFLRFMGIYNQAQEGYMQLRATGRNINNMTGQMGIEDILVSDDANLVKIFAESGPNPNRPDIYNVRFKLLKTEFQIEDELIYVNDMQLFGPSDRLKLQGKSNSVTGRFKFQGDYCADYLSNASFGSIPLFGPLLSGGSENCLSATPIKIERDKSGDCLLYTSPSPRD